MPDFFVPLDTLQYTKYHRQLSARSIVLNASLRYIDNNRKQLKSRYATFEQFNRQFEVPQSLIDEIIAEADKQKVKPQDDAEMKRTLPYLRNQLKSLVARDIWDMSEYFHIANDQNHIYQKGLEVISQ